MAKSSRYMQALLSVIASGRRRKPVYIRQQALVSKLYPYFLRTDTLVAEDAVYGFGMIYVKPPVEINIEPDFLAVSDAVYGFTFRQTLVNQPAEDGLSTNNSVYTFLFKQTKVEANSADGLITSESVHSFYFTQAGIYSSAEDTLDVQSGVYGFYLGE